MIEALVGPFLGALLGIPAGLALDRMVERRRLVKQREGIVPALRKALGRNVELIDQLSREFDEKGLGWVPTYGFDLTLLDATASQKYDLGIPLDACRRVDVARYELAHLNGKLEILRLSRASLGTGSNAFTQEVARTCRNHLGPARECVENAVAGIGG